jgi:orotate phosphoribosyltransferase
VTTGGAILEAVRALRSEGAIVDRAVCVLDRSQGGGPRLKEIGVSLEAAFVSDVS